MLERGLDMRGIIVCFGKEEIRTISDTGTLVQSRSGGDEAGSGDEGNGSLREVHLDMLCYVKKGRERVTSWECKYG